MMMRYLLFFVVSVLSFACAHYPDVRPGEKEHKVLVYGEDEQKGFKNAMSQAEDYCDDVEKKKGVIVLKEDKKYVGSMEESTYKSAKTASKIAGGLAGIMGGEKESRSGRSLSNIDMGKPYEISMTFKCR